MVEDSLTHPSRTGEVFRPLYADEARPITYWRALDASELVSSFKCESLHIYHIFKRALFYPILSRGKRNMRQLTAL